MTILNNCDCQKPKHGKSKILKSSSAENPGSYYAACNKFPKNGKCDFFRWIDTSVLKPHILVGLSNFIFCFYHLIYLTELSKNVKVI